MLPASRRAQSGSLRSFVHMPATRHRTGARKLSSSPLTPDALEALLAKPSWSVKSLQSQQYRSDDSAPTISKKQLHHLLRLSALPLPKSEAEEASMVQTLESQLQFVQAIQKIDTAGVEPLQSLRDETGEAERENEITVETLRSELDGEEQVGFARRIVRKRDSAVEINDLEEWDPLEQAPKRLGGYIVVNTKTS